MNDIIQIIIYNLLICGILYYDIKYGAVIIILMVIYWITIKSSMKKKLVEGYGFFTDFVDMSSSVKNEFDLILPTSVQYNSMDEDHSTIYSFYKGGGNQGIIKTDNMTRLDETYKLLDKLINLFENKQQHCIGFFEKYSECNKECGFGKQKKKYTIVQQKGINGISCPYEEGKIISKPCTLRDCKLDEKCRYDEECISGYCDQRTKKCDNIYKCSEDELYYCLKEDECMKLNGTNKYIWDNRTETCSKDMDKDLRIEEDVYKTRKYGSQDGGEGGGEGGGDSKPDTTTTPTTTPSIQEQCNDSIILGLKKSERNSLPQEYCGKLWEKLKAGGDIDDAEVFNGDSCKSYLKSGSAKYLLFEKNQPPLNSPFCGNLAGDTTEATLSPACEQIFEAGVSDINTDKCQDKAKFLNSLSNFTVEPPCNIEKTLFNKKIQDKWTTICN